MGQARDRARRIERIVRDHRTALAGGAVGSLALLLPPWLVRLRTAPLAVSEDDEIAVKLALGAAVFAALAAEAVWNRGLSAAGREPVRRAGFVLGLAAALGVAAYFNFGFFHGRGFVHHWDQFHYHLGSKYFPELGYDGLYAASVGAQADAFPGTKVATHTRDLRTYRVEPVESLFPHMREVWRRFTPERWEAFVRDNRHFVEATSSDHLGAWRLDHGYNATPAWTFVARLFHGDRSTTHAVLVAHGLLDVALLAVLFASIFATFGSRVGCWCLVLFGFSYVGRFYWTGGSFLRHDWLAAVGVGVCMLQRRRHAGAGGLLGYAAAVRVFPALFLVGPGLLALRALARREPSTWVYRLATGFTAAAVAGLLLGSATGRGPGAWLEFGTAIHMHADEWLTNNAGLSIPFVYDRAVLERRDVDWQAPEPWIHVQPRVRQLHAERAAWIWATRLAFLALVGLAIWRMALPEAALAGMAVVFALLTPTSYYWIAIVLLPLARRTDVTFGALALGLAMHVVHLWYPAFEMRFAVLSVGLGALFLAWMAPEALRTLRAVLRPRVAVSAAS